MFSKVGDSVVEVVGMIYGDKYTKAVETSSIRRTIGVPWEDFGASLCKSLSPMVTFTSILNMFVVMSEVHTSSCNDLADETSGGMTVVFSRDEGLIIGIASGVSGTSSSLEDAAGITSCLFLSSW